MMGSCFVAPWSLGEFWEGWRLKTDLPWQDRFGDRSVVAVSC